MEKIKSSCFSSTIVLVLHNSSVVLFSKLSLRFLQPFSVDHAPRDKKCWYVYYYIKTFSCVGVIWQIVRTPRFCDEQFCNQPQKTEVVIGRWIFKTDIATPRFFQGKLTVFVIEFYAHQVGVGRSWKMETDQRQTKGKWATIWVDLPLKMSELKA